jgi:hypothetical protein
MQGALAKPTAIQRYHLGLLSVARGFGAVFASAAILVTLSNLPGAIMSGDGGRLAINLAAGAGFLAIGLLLFKASSHLLRQYRAYVADQAD